jgi:hypothetical protein
VDGADDKMVLTAFISGLQSGDFLFSVYKDPPTSMSEMMYEAQRYMNGEDALQARRNRKRKEEMTTPTVQMKLLSRNQRCKKSRQETRRQESKGIKREVQPFHPTKRPCGSHIHADQRHPALRWPGKLLTNPIEGQKTNIAVFIGIMVIIRKIVTT